mmetsp:Transcript_12516/g.37584  ORF Transcript_12516/g.37584 Transcript_12516/m.37584 type:complete len:425 (-) Transcript_12516:30-1304(-)
MSAHAGHAHARAAPRHRPRRLPVVVLTGYLGAGKTTLLNYILREQSDKKLAVIENEIGEVSIDDSLVEQKHQEMGEELVVLDNGCICCTIRKDLVATLLKVAEKVQNGHALDGVLIELTGAADPAPVVQTFFMKEEIGAAFFVDNVVALVDAKHALMKLAEANDDPDAKGTACAQIAFSSTVLLNKVDLADEKRLAEIEARVREINTTAEVIRCQNAAAPLSKLFGVGAFNLAKVLAEAAPFNGFRGSEDDFASGWMKPRMDKSISNVGVRCEGMIGMDLFQRFMDDLLATDEDAMDFLRVKAVLNVAGSDKKFVLQAIHMLRHGGFVDAEWAEGEARESKIIFIGRGMQPRRKALTDAFQACVVQPPRFAVGTEVLANVGAWERGRVIAHWDDLKPYRVRLHTGREVYAPLDDDCVIRAAADS